MILPFQRESGQYEVPPVFWMNPDDNKPYGSSDVTACLVDVLNLDVVPSTVIASNVVMTFDANARAYRAHRTVADLDGVRSVGFYYKPTSSVSGALVFQFLRQRWVVDVLKRQDELEVILNAVKAATDTIQDAGGSAGTSNSLHNRLSLLASVVAGLKGAGWDVNTDTLEKIRDAIQASATTGDVDFWGT